MTTRPFGRRAPSAGRFRLAGIGHIGNSSRAAGQIIAAVPDRASAVVRIGSVAGSAA